MAVFVAISVSKAPEISSRDPERKENQPVVVLKKESMTPSSQRTEEKSL